MTKERSIGKLAGINFVFNFLIVKHFTIIRFLKG